MYKLRVLFSFVTDLNYRLSWLPRLAVGDRNVGAVQLVHGVVKLLLNRCRNLYDSDLSCLLCLLLEAWRDTTFPDAAEDRTADDNKRDGDDDGNHLGCKEAFECEASRALLDRLLTDLLRGTCNVHCLEAKCVDPNSWELTTPDANEPRLAVSVDVDPSLLAFRRVSRVAVLSDSSGGLQLHCDDNKGVCVDCHRLDGPIGVQEVPVTDVGRGEIRRFQVAESSRSGQSKRVVPAVSGFVIGSSEELDSHKVSRWEGAELDVGQLVCGAELGRDVRPV